MAQPGTEMIPLANAWSVWTSKWKGQPNVTHLGKFDSVQGFWAYFKNSPPSQLADKCYLHIFKEGVAPMWEDPQNATGGHFKLLANTQESSIKMWQTLILNLIGELFALEKQPETEEPSNHLVNGASIVVHGVGNNIIKLWLATTDKEVVARCKAFLIATLDEDDYVKDKITFVPHKLVIKGSSQKTPQKESFEFGIEGASSRNSSRNSSPVPSPTHNSGKPAAWSAPLDDRGRRPSDASHDDRGRRPSGLGPMLDNGHIGLRVGTNGSRSPDSRSPNPSPGNRSPNNRSPNSRNRNANRRRTENRDQRRKSEDSTYSADYSVDNVSIGNLSIGGSAGVSPNKSPMAGQAPFNHSVGTNAFPQLAEQVVPVVQHDPYYNPATNYNHNKSVFVTSNPPGQPPAQQQPQLYRSPAPLLANAPQLQPYVWVSGGGR